MRAKVVLLTTLPAAIQVHASGCTVQTVSSPELFSRNHRLESADGNEFKLKGLNWFGFETSLFIAHGLWAQNVDYFLDFITEHKFNAIRMPLSVDNVLADSEELPPAYDYLTCQFDGQITSLEALDFLIERFAERGVLVLLDQHRLDNANISPCYTDGSHPESMIIEFWDALIDRYKDSWNVMGVDLKNEPYGCEWQDWANFAMRMGNHILERVPHWLIFVNGIGSDPGEDALDRCVEYSSCTEGTFWGENLMGACGYPIMFNTTEKQEKIVLSPHVYGPSVYQQVYFDDASFPDNMPDIWNCHFGYLKEQTERAVVVGEWGGEYTDSKNGRKKDKTWQDAYADWAKNTTLPGSFYWCLNKNSGDTGGLLTGQNWQTPEDEKLALLEALYPDPTHIHTIGVEYCFENWSDATIPTYSPWPCDSTPTAAPCTGGGNNAQCEPTDSIVSSDVCCSEYCKPNGGCSNP